MKLRLLFLLALLTALPAFGEPAGDMTYVLVTFRNTPLGVLNRANYPDLADLKNRSAVGLMNSRTAGKTCFQNMAATIASGSRTSIYPESSRLAPFEHFLRYPPQTLSALADNPYYLNGCIAEETNHIFEQALRDLYTRTKRRDVPPGALINPGAARLTDVEKSINPSAKPGLLADALGDFRVKIALYGCSTCLRLHSYEQLPYRPSWLLGCRSGGAAVVTDHDDLLISSPAGPMGCVTDYGSAAGRIAAIEGNTFAVVEAGDFLRLAAERDFYGSDEYTVALEDVRKRFYSFLADLDKALSESGRRYRVCAVSLEQAGQPNALLPVLIFGSDIKEPCLLTSQSTKRPGIIACADLTQDIFAFFGISCPTSGFAPEPCPGDAETLSKQANQMLLTYKARPTVVVIFVVLTGICAISLLVCLIFYRRLPRRTKDLFWALTIAVMLVPLAIFISPALNIYSLPKTGLFYIAFALAGSLLLRRLSAEKLILTVCSAVSLIILADTFTGSFLSKHSLLSYDPMVGARFYGLGNEYAGILMACSMLTIYLLWQRFSGCKSFAVPVILASLLVIAAIGMPSAGTNFGGMLAAILGFACAFALSRSLKPGAKTVIAAAVCILLLIPAMIFLNVHAPQSHIGRFFSTALQGDSAMVLSTVTRKLAMNISLMQASRWVWALISCLVFLIAILFNPRGLTKKLFDTRKKLNAGFCGLIFGLAVGFAVNDSGVVMMATGIMYLTFALALLLLKTAEEEQAGP